MKIFISWSGDLSRGIGEVLRNWIPGVLQMAKPYFTPEDIEKGTRWGVEIAKELEQSQIGIMLLTKDNLGSAWMMFEAGALSKQMDKSHICPILFGIENTDLIGPFVQFQTTPFSKEEMRKLVRTINNACGEQKLEDAVLDNVFEMWWPKLETQITSILSMHKNKPEKKIRSERDLIEEILSLVRMSTSMPRSEHFINPLAIRELERYFLGLSNACAQHNEDDIQTQLRYLQRPVEYLIRIFPGGSQPPLEDTIIANPPFMPKVPSESPHRVTRRITHGSHTSESKT